MTTTHTINGLRLVSPEEAGKSSRGKSGCTIKAVILSDGHPKWAISTTDTMYFEAELVDLPKPRTTRPYRRGEVKLGDMFRNKEDGYDKIVSCVTNRGVDLGCIFCAYSDLMLFYDRLTYDSEGREVLECAGKVEEQ